jgi:hypothetical protein
VGRQAGRQVGLGLGVGLGLLFVLSIPYGSIILLWHQCVTLNFSLMCH